MSDIPKPWFMFNRDNNDNDNESERLNEELDRLIDGIQAKIDALEEKEEESAFDSDTECFDDVDYDDECSEYDEGSDEDKQFTYINEKLSVFPESTKLLWTAVRIALKKRRPIIADDYFKKLINIPIKKHDFNTIVSEIQYMLSDPFGRTLHIRKYVRFLQKRYPTREEGIFYEGLLEEALGNWDKAIRLFISATEKCKRAPRSAEHLSNIMLDAGEYEEVIKYVKLAYMMSASKKPIVNKSDLDYNKYLAKDSLLRQRDIDGVSISTDEIDELRRSYEKLRIDHVELKNDPTLQERINELNSLKDEIDK